MFIRTRLRVPQDPREFGQLQLVSSVLSFATSLYSSYTNKSIATKNRRLERAIAGQQLALQEKALAVEKGYQEKVLALEEMKAKTWAESEMIKAKALAEAPSLNTYGAVRIDPSMINAAPISIPSGGVRGAGYYSTVAEEVTPTPTLTARLGLPEKVFGFPIKYAIMGGSLIILLTLTRKN